MCGRTCLLLTEDEVRSACTYKPKGYRRYVKLQLLPEFNACNYYIPSYNISPMAVTPVLVSASKFINVGWYDRVIKPMMWGLVPPWHRGDYNTDNFCTHNCRLENIKDSELYYPLLKSGGRCVVVANGYYDWQTDKTSGAKQPYYIYAPQKETVKTDDRETGKLKFDENTGWYGSKLLYMAGLYDVLRNDDFYVYSYTIITMESNSTLDWLHDRMPAILDTEEQIEAWLDVKNVKADMALSYLKPVKVLSWHPVSTYVNNPANDSEECNKRVVIEKKTDSQKPITTCFTKQEKRSSDAKSPDTKRLNNNKVE